MACWLLFSLWFSWGGQPRFGAPRTLGQSDNIFLGGGGRSCPPGKFSKFGFWNFWHFWAKSKGLKSHLAIHILTQIYFFIKIKAAVGKQAISLQTIASNAIVNIFWRTRKLDHASLPGKRAMPKVFYYAYVPSTLTATLDAAVQEYGKPNWTKVYRE